MFLAGFISLLTSFYAANLVSCQPTTEEIRQISAEIWANDLNRMSEDDVVFDMHSSPIFSYVNEAKLVGTYARFMDLFDNYTPHTGIPEVCGQVCWDEEIAFLDAIYSTRPIQLLHNWLLGKGLADSTAEGFKAQLRQYWFMLYTRSGGPLDSSGFEHTMLGEIRSGAVLGMHNWLHVYFEEKNGNFQSNYLRQCPNDVYAFSLVWMGYPKPISSFFVRTSPEVEIALATLCLLTRVGTGCPVTLDGINRSMTAWDMTNLPKTIGTAYPNC